MKKKIIVLIVIATWFISPITAQQMGDGNSSIIYNFNSPLLSGGYNGCTVYGITGSVPDSDHPWQHLFTIRHPNLNNNHQLQLGSSFASNDRLFFRKIAVSDVSDGNSNWIELATRGSNTFNGNQTINGEIIWTLAQKNFSAAPREGVSSMSMRLWDNYNGGGPTSYGTLLEIYGRPGHMVSQLYFGGWDNSRIRYREAFYNQNQWNDWRYLLDSKNDLESEGSLKLNGSGPHFFYKGNVIIGKASQSNTTYKLDVAGKIRADEITVNTTGADFVFHSSYKLRSLSELETFIKSYQRLPDIVPASQMQEEGVSVSEMQTKLLQKVEELTLYVIEQQKIISRQQQQISEMNDRLNKIKP